MKNIKNNYIINIFLNISIIGLLIFIGYSIKNDISYFSVIETLKMVCLYLLLFSPLVLSFIYKKITYATKIYSKKVDSFIFIFSFLMVSFFILY